METTTEVASSGARSMAQLEEKVSKVRDAARRFAALTLEERIALLGALREGYHRVAKDSVVAACRAKGIDPGGPLSGEEWLLGPLIVLRNLRLLEQSLREIATWGVPRIRPEDLGELADGRVSVRVHPTTGLDAMLLPGTEARVHLRSGVTRSQVAEHQAAFYRHPHKGRVCLVLGAGNVNAIPPTDTLYKMFVEGMVCILKMNPVNAYLGPYLEHAFAPLIERHFLEVVYGGAEEGGFLARHPAVDSIHITGSDRTYDALVWGPEGPEREARKASGNRVLDKEITAELGNISPILVVPGPYSDSDLRFWGRNLAGMVANNASFNCVAAKLLVSPKGWGGREQLWERTADGLGQATVRKPYYPGAEARWEHFVEGRAGVKVVGERGPDRLPYAMIADVDPTREADPVFRQEPWCTVFSETAVGSADPERFLTEAVEWVNEHLWGTLCATVVVHPSTLADPKVAATFERALAELRYGTVSVNTWSGAAFGLTSTPWGAHPSSTPEDIQSGQGFVHDTPMLGCVEKTVLRAPLSPLMAPPWVPGHRTQDVLGQRLTEMEYRPSWWKVPSLAAAAMKA